MAGRPHLGDLWTRYPGLRVARTWDRFETIITTILGQLVSVSFGRTLVRELMQSSGERVSIGLRAGDTSLSNSGAAPHR